MILAFQMSFRNPRPFGIDANTNIFKFSALQHFRGRFWSESGTAQPCTKIGHPNDSKKIR
jgi:hypothetical protein